MTGPVGGAGELTVRYPQTFEQWWESVNQFSTDSDRLDHTVMVLSSPFQARRCAAEAAWSAALVAAKAPQGVPRCELSKDDSGCVYGTGEAAAPKPAPPIDLDALELTAPTFADAASQEEFQAGATPAPGAPTKSKWSQDYIDGRESILKLIDGGFGRMTRAQTLELEQLRADRHASAERVRPLRDGLERLTKATANFTGSQRSKERVKEALRVAMEILTDDDKKLAGALPPSTGEKSQ